MCVSVLLLLVMFGKGLLLQPTCDRRANLQLRWDDGNVQLIIGMVLPCCTRLCVFVFRNPPTCLAAIHIDFAGKIPSIRTAEQKVLGIRWGTTVVMGGVRSQG